MAESTFHESWHRVASLRPQLRPSVRVARQHFRGSRWHVVEDPASGQFFRLDEPGYDFIARFDGKTAVDDAWRASLARLGDASLTQTEAVALLGQMWQSNLIRAEAAGDTAALFERQRERRAREIRGHLASLLFLRLPLFDPDAWLNRWCFLFAWLVSPLGLFLWLTLVGAGVWTAIERSDVLWRETANVLAGPNLLPLSIVFVVLKALHEMGHAVTCKVLGKRAGRGGEVHEVGLMLLVFMPVPYVDATSAWGLRSRGARIAVSAAGVMVELACASIAAIVWARTAEGTLVNALAYNTMFVASVSTLVFNGNPLLRYDAYYVLSDLLAVPNLASRSTEYIHYLVKSRVFGVRDLRMPARDGPERGLLLCYGLLSAIYRVVVYASIALFIASQQFLIGGLMIVFGVVTWCLIPISRFVRYLSTHHELDRTRPRAIVVTFTAATVVVLPLATIPVPDRVVAEGVIEPARFEVVSSRIDGFVEEVTPTETSVRAGDGRVLVRQRNEDLERRAAILDAELERLRVSRALVFREDPARVTQIDRQIEAIRAQMGWVAQQKSWLVTTPGIDGTWIAPGASRMHGVHVTRGTPIGMVADLSEMRARVVLDQRVAGLVIAEGEPVVNLRAMMRPTPELTGELELVIPGGQRALPSAALGVAGGGSTPTSADDREGLRPVEQVFEAWVTVPVDRGLLPGQRVATRFSLRPKPLFDQWARSLRQVLQQRFRI
jgi:putative peptide zinc metalloprotease protein